MIYLVAVLIVGAAWCVVAFIVALVLGPRLRARAATYPEPAHEEESSRP